MPGGWLASSSSIRADSYLIIRYMEDSPVHRQDSCGSYADPVKKAMSNGMKYLFDRPALYTTALQAPQRMHFKVCQWSLSARISLLPLSTRTTCISGPSKTADIEQALVMGAQAARGVTVVLV